MVFADVYSLSKDMSSISVILTRPVTHNLDEDTLTSKFDVIITGPRDSYKLYWALDYTTIKKGEYT